MQFSDWWSSCLMGWGGGGLRAKTTVTQVRNDPNVSLSFWLNGRAEIRNQFFSLKQNDPSALIGIKWVAEAAARAERAPDSRRLASSLLLGSGGCSSCSKIYRNPPAECWLTNYPPEGPETTLLNINPHGESLRRVALWCTAYKLEPIRWWRGPSLSHTPSADYRGEMAAYISIGCCGTGASETEHVVPGTPPSRAVNKETFHFLLPPSSPLMEPRQGWAGVGRAKREENQASLSANVRCTLLVLHANIMLNMDFRHLLQLY